MGHDRSYLWAVEAEEEEEDRSAWAFFGRGRQVMPSYVSASGYKRTFSLIIYSVVFELLSESRFPPPS